MQKALPQNQINAKSDNSTINTQKQFGTPWGSVSIKVFPVPIPCARLPS